MSYYFYSVDVNKVLGHVDKVIEKQKNIVKIWSELARTLKPYNGKVVNKRIVVFIEKSMPDYKIYYYKRYGRHELTIYINDYRWNNNAPQFHLGNDPKEGLLKLDINIINESLKHSIEVLAQYQQASEKTLETVHRFNLMLDCFKSAEEQLKSIPGFYEMSRYY